MGQFDTLRERVKEILLLRWDPIGVSDVENAQDEYDAYVLAVVRSHSSAKDGRAVARPVAGDRGRSDGVAR
jgi:hypothetical protein